MRIIFAGGGTGGHINPALSIANYIRERDKNFEALFIGTKRGLETKLVPQAGYKIEYIDIQGFDRKNIFKNIEVLKKLSDSKRKCREIIKEFNPDVVVCTGGYVSGPVAVAAHKLNIPSLIHEQNVYPGLTVKASQNYVNYVAVSFPETINHMNKPKKCVLTGNPIREELLREDKTSARKALGLSDKPFVLIFGGSLGASKINENVVKIIPELIKDNKVQLLFGTGERNFEEIINELNNVKLSDDIKIVPYINNMHTAMAAADLVVCRSGAITLSEIAALRKPSVLIPSPNVVRNHQEQNAREFEKMGAAAVICENELTPDVLYNKICELTKDGKKLHQMGDNAFKLAKPDALEELYKLVLKCCESKK
ncbi:MAG: undecaprenyldiphospho-muramoylpentapeptide beta-N-acetylglucosaminyltransferase [Clostridia bacterium]|nr:undecaprenyldiphospho-muramoylpentapeptide beta-N-acetylglucosaminyltransferase [Clostridia bacterium]